MHKAAKDNLVRILAASATLGEGIDVTARRTIALADNAYNLRRLDYLSQHARALIALPGRYEPIGKYYLGLATLRQGQGRLDLAQKLFDEAVAHAPDVYKARAVLALGSVAEYRGDAESKLRFYREALRFKRLDYFTLTETNRAIALAASREGHHAGALQHLERFLPIVKASRDPRLYLDYLNSLAVELGEMGRKQEARSMIRHVIASPFAVAYPEWRETAEELRSANRSFAAIKLPRPAPRNVLAMPVLKRGGAGLPAWAGRPAPVINYEQWRRRDAKRKKDDGKKSVNEMSEREMVIEIFRLASTSDLRYDQLSKILTYIEKVLSEPARPYTPGDDKTEA